MNDSVELGSTRVVHRSSFMSVAAGPSRRLWYRRIFCFPNRPDGWKNFCVDTEDRSARRLAPLQWTSKRGLVPIFAAEPSRQSRYRRIFDPIDRPDGLWNFCVDTEIRSARRHLTNGPPFTAPMVIGAPCGVLSNRVIRPFR